MNISDIERLLDNSATIETKIEILPRYAGESLITITNDDSIKSWEYADTRYVPDNGFIGMFVERALEGELHNITPDFNIENREIILYLGIRVYDVDSKTYTTTFYSLGNFIVDKPESDEVKDNTKFTAKDYTIKFNVNFNPDYTDDEYTKSFTTMLSEQGSVTALWLAKYTCKQCDVELGNEDFTNSDFYIDSNQFQNGEQCRDIIKAIAKLACSWARIDWDNKVYIDFYVKDDVEHDYNNITKDDYYELTVQKDTYGPINKVVFGSSIIEGDYSFVSDSESITNNGENSFVINDNPILYTEEIRERAVQNASVLLGLQYTPLEIKTIGHPWLKGNELISILDSADNLVYTYPLDRVIEYDGHIKTLITSYAPTKVVENYTYSGTGTSKNTQRQTKIVLDRANQQLKTLVEKTDEHSSKITSLTQDLDSVNINVSNIQKGLETTNSNLESTNEDVDNLQSQIQGVSADFEEFKDNEYVQSIDNLQKQIDGAIQFWNGAEIPTLNNYPANEWTTEADRINHQADIYTVIQDVEGELKQGKAYRFDKVDGVWQWIELTDNELSAVQEIAQNALKQANTNATDITTLKQTDTEIKANIEGIQLNYNTLNNQFDSTVITSKTVEGNPIHITDAGDYDLDRLYLEGNNYQETTQQGKNICPTDVSDWELGQWVIGGGTNVYQNRIRVNRLIPCEPNTTYYVQTFLASRVFAIRTYKSDGTYNTSIGAVARGGTFTTDENSYYLAITIYSELSGTEDLLALIESGELKPFICLESETDKSFEEYIPDSPSPDYPQEIEVIEGSVDVEVLGANRLNSYVTTQTKNGITISYNENTQEITLNGTCTANNTTFTFDSLVNRFVVPANQNLYLKIKYISGSISGTASFQCYNSTYGKGVSKAFANNDVENVKIYDTEYTLRYIYPRIESGCVFNNYKFKVMLSFDDVDYEEYKLRTTSLDLQDEFVGKCTTLDTLDVVTGKLNKNVGRVQLNGLESLTIEVNSGVPYTRFSTTILNGRGAGVQNRYPIKSTHFKNIASGGHDVGGAFIYQSKLFIYLPLDITSVEQAKAWLAENQPIFYYDLAEPYEVQLDSTSIELNEGVNNIYVKTNICPSFISLTYLTDSILNSQYATKTQLQLTKDSITSVVKDTTTLNANLTDLQALVNKETTDLKNALGDLTNDLEENYATNDSVLTVSNSVTNIQTSLNQQIEITKDIQVNGVSKVKTTTGFTFDEDGLTVTKTNADTKTTIDEDGMTVYSTTGSENTEMLVVDSQGVEAENVTVRTFLIVGSNSRFQDYETGTGCFYVGE